MTVKELIAELLASCESQDEQVVCNDSGLVTRVNGGKLAGTGEPCVMLNYYPPSRETTGQETPNG